MSKKNTFAIITRFEFELEMFVCSSKVTDTVMQSDLITENTS